MIEIFKGQHKI